MKFKKRLSIFMVFILILASFLTAFQTKAAENRDVSVMLNEYGEEYGFSSAINAANANEKLPRIEAILTEYSKLASNKDELGSDFFCNLNTLLYYYLRYIEGSSVANAAYINSYIENNVATPNMLEARKLARIIYGNTDFVYTKPDGNGGSIKFTASLNYADVNNKSAYEQLINYMKTLSPIVMEYLGLFNTSYNFSTAPQNGITVRAFALHIKYLSDNIPGLSREAAVEKTLQNYDALGEKYTLACSLVLETKSALQKYMESGAALDASAFKDLQAKSGAFPLTTISALNGMSSASSSSGYSFANINGKSLTPYHAIGLALRSNAFIDVLDDIKSFELATPSNEKIKLIKSKTEQIPVTFRGFIQSENFVELYNEILASYQKNPNRPQKDATIPNKDGYQKSSINYPSPSRKLFTSLALCTLEPLAAMITQLQIDDVGKVLYTNENVSLLAGLNAVVHDELQREAGNDWGILQSLIRNQGAVPNTRTLAKHLTEERFADARAKLEGLADWSEYDPNDYNWGVDGRESFITAAAAVLRPVSALLYYNAHVPDKYDSYGDFASDGKYETVLIPLLEALGCRGIVPTDEFMKIALNLPSYSGSGDNAVHGKRQDALAIALIDPILNLLEDILSNPLAAVLDILPRLAYAEQNGDLDALYDWELDFSLKKSSFVPFKSLQELMDMLAPTLPISLPEINWNYLAHMGELEHRQSVNGKAVYKNFVIADRADVFTYLLCSILGKDDNTQILGDMLFATLGINIKTSELFALHRACKNGDPLEAARTMIKICKGIINGNQTVCCEDKTICSCGTDICPNDCSCSCGTVDLTDKPVSSGGSVGFSGFISAFVKFFASALKNTFGFFCKLPTA